MSTAQATGTITAEQAAAAAAVLNAGAPAAKEVTVMQRIKGAATGPTAKTIGWIALSTVAGALGGLAAVEARNRGVIGKASAAPMAKPAK